MAGMVNKWQCSNQRLWSTANRSRSLIESKEIPEKDWEELKIRVIQGGKNIIDLRGRSSFQSPAYLSIEMIAATMGELFVQMVNRRVRQRQEIQPYYDGNGDNHK